MTQQTINIGTAANSRNGDPLRTAFTKINTNFSELYTNLNSGANLGSFKISGNILGTQGADANSWGLSGIGIDPGGESYAGIWIPDVSSQSNGASLDVYNSSVDGGPIRLLTHGGVWSFGADGKLAGPGMGNLLLAGSLVSASEKLVFGAAWDSSTDVIERQFDPSYESNMMFTTVPANQFNLAGSPRGPNNMWGYPVSMFDDGLIFTGYQFDSALNSINDHSIVNNNGGNLNLVTDVVSVPVSTPFEQTIDYDSIVWNGTTVTINATSGSPAHMALASLRTGEQLTLRTSSTSYVVTLATIFNFNDSFQVQETSPESNLNIVGIDIDVASTTYNFWSFKQSGATLFPTLTVDIHNGGLQSAETLQFGNASLQSIITGPTPAQDQNAQRLIIQGQRATGTGEGGDVYLWGGDAQFNGGDIKIYAGDADDQSSGYGGYVNIDGGRGFNYGGNVSITGGDSPGGTGGTVSIRSGSGATGADNGLVTIQVGSYYWQFDRTGALLLPAGGDIKNNSGTSILPVAGQQTYVFDGVNTTLTITPLNFNLLFCQPAVGYTGNDGHTVSLPAGIPGQRLVIVNNSSLCTLTVTGAIDGGDVVVNPSTTAELIYSSGTGITGWFVMYGAAPTI